MLNEATMNLSIRTRLLALVLAGGLTSIGISVVAWQGIENLHSGDGQIFTKTGPLTATADPNPSPAAPSPARIVCVRVQPPPGKRPYIRTRPSSAPAVSNSGSPMAAAPSSLATALPSRPPLPVGTAMTAASAHGGASVTSGS